MLTEWANQIHNRKQSGMTVAEWSAIQGYSKKTYYYRLKRVREELLEAAESREINVINSDPVFAAVPIPTNNVTSITVRFGICSIEIPNGADAITFAKVLQIVSRL